MDRWTYFKRDERQMPKKEEDKFKLLKLKSGFFKNNYEDNC